MYIANSVHQVNLFQHIFGTSRTSEVINSVIVIFSLILVSKFIILPVSRLVLDALDFRRLRKRKLVFLELTPPSVNTKTLLATAQMVTAIHGLISMGTRKDRWLHRKRVLSCEFVSDRAGGIRFIVPLDPGDVAQFKQLAVSYLPDIKFHETKDYLTAVLSGRSFRVLEFRQTHHFAYRIAVQDALNEHDPIGYIMESMAKPLPDELTAFQLVMSPASTRVSDKVRNQLLNGQDSSLHRKLWHYPFILLWVVVKAIMAVFGGILEMIGDEVSGVHSARKSSTYQYKPSKVAPATKHVLNDLHSKLDEPLFNVDIRALIVGADSTQRAQGIINSLNQFRVPGYQGLALRRTFPKKKMLKHRIEAFHKRLPSVLTRNSCVLSTSEVASLYHFPYGETTQTENLIKSMSKTLPAPIAIKRGADNAGFDVELGVNHHHGNDTPIGLTEAEREKHLYIIGGTGNGKTTMMEYAIVQDINAGKGVALIDPHGDSAQKLLGYIPESRFDDVIYLNPEDIDHPIGLNLLELPEGLSDSQLLLEKERVTEAVVSILRKVFSDDMANAHRIEAMLRNAIRTAFTVPDATLFTALKLIRNAEFRKKVVAKLEDEHLKDFWLEEFGVAGNMQRVSMSKGLTHRLDRFESSEPVSRMFGQIKSTINFEDIINSSKILICNFPQDMGEDTSALFGTTILAMLKIAAERRARMLIDDRKPFYVYVDEFQNFATTPFVKMLSAARKYKLFLTIAEQSTSQQEEQRLTEAILANVGTVVCFRTGSPADQRLLLPRFEPFIDKGNIGNLPAYNFYIRIQANDSLEPLSGETVVLDKQARSDAGARVVIETSQENYAVEYKEPPKLKKTDITPMQSTYINKPDAVNRKAVRRRTKSKK